MLLEVQIKYYRLTAVVYSVLASLMLSSVIHGDVFTNRTSKMSETSHVGQLVNEGVYRMESHAILNALYDLLHFWGCRPTAFVIHNGTGFDEDVIFNYFQPRSVDCAPKIVINISDDRHGQDEIYCQLLQFRNIVYIDYQQIRQFFTKVSQCNGLLESMHTWIVVSQYSTIKHFNSNGLLNLTNSPMSQITFFVPLTSHHDISWTNDYTIDSLYNRYGHVSRVDIYDVFYSDFSLAVEAILFAYWTRKERIHYLDKIEGPNQLKGRKVRIVIVTSTCPFVCVTGPNNDILTRGYLVDLFSALEGPLNVKHVHHISKDGTFGTASPNGSFNGFIGQLQRGEQDLGMMSTSITEQRKRYAIHYGAVLINGDMQMTIKRPTSMVPPTIYMLPFELSVWFTVFGFVIFIYVIMVIIHKVNLATDIQDLELDNLQRNITGRQKVSLDFFDQMNDFRGLAARAVTLTQAIAALLIFTYYTSMLTSVLTYRETKLPFLTLDEMVDKDDYKVLVVKDTIYQHAFEQAKEGVYKRIWRNIVDNGKRGLLASFNQGFRVLSRKDKYVYLTNGFILQNVVKQSCSLMFVPAKYMKETFNLPVRKDFPYLNIYANSLLKLRESGVYNRLEKQYITSDYLKCGDKGVSETLELTQVYALFVFMLVGCLLSLVSLVLENLVYFYKHRDTTAVSELH